MTIRPETVTVTTTPTDIVGPAGPRKNSGFFKVPADAGQSILVSDPDTPANTIPVAAGELFRWEADYGEQVFVSVASGTEDIYVARQGVA